jgi:hypothetical protein
MELGDNGGQIIDAGSILQKHAMELSTERPADDRD